MTFTSPTERHKPPFVGTEREQMRAWLDYHRATILHKLEGLDDEQLRRVMVPSGPTRTSASSRVRVPTKS